VQRRDRAVSFALDLVQAHNQKYALRGLFADNIHLLARNVTENASHTGEHYIADSRGEYAAMLRSSAGAGVIVGFMALLKLQASYLRAAPLIEAFLYSLNYSFGFMLIHVLHFTVATKQPAMTASRIAADLHVQDRRQLDIDSLADLIVKVIRTQFVAVLGNLITAFPTALAIAMVWVKVSGHHLVSVDKARHLLHDIDPFGSLALFHAAIAGVCLFLAGMISGYFDNRAVYTHMAQRIARLRSWRRMLGPLRQARVAAYIENNLGGLMGNLFFGILLGTIGTLGDLLGLPVDIRHITFSAANLATALVGLDYQIAPSALADACAGVLLIGLTNLLVSFALALFVALRSRQVRFTKGMSLVKALLTRLVRRPLDFFIAPKSPVSIREVEP
ncbi:MAG: site-specific recombinase, partial [Pseudomonadota bacterium]|nr:site-specific recombinase [Pseudomonadota bacterium]